MSLTAASEIPLSWIDCQAGNMPARDEVFEENVIVKLGPPALVTQMGLQLTFNTCSN